MLENGVGVERRDLALAREESFEEAVTLFEGCALADLPTKGNIEGSESAGFTWSSHGAVAMDGAKCVAYR